MTSLRAITTLAWWAAAALLAACSGVDGEVREAIRKHVSAKENCLKLRFPVTVRVGPGLFGTPAFRLNELKVLGDAGVIHPVHSRPRTVGGGIRIDEVTLDLTDAGRRSVRDGSLCYGRTELVELIDYTEGRARDGAQAITARVALKHHVEADWARDPAFATQVKSGDGQDEVTLVKTNKGWRLSP